MTNSEVDLNKVRLREELKFVEGKINRLKGSISDLTDQLRWEYIRKQDILSELNEYTA